MRSVLIQTWEHASYHIEAVRVTTQDVWTHELIRRRRLIRKLWVDMKCKRKIWDGVKPLTSSQVFTVVLWLRKGIEEVTLLLMTGEFARRCCFSPKNALLSEKEFLLSVLFHLLLKARWHEVSHLSRSFLRGENNFLRQRTTFQRN